MLLSFKTYIDQCKLMMAQMCYSLSIESSFRTYYADMFYSNSDLLFAFSSYRFEPPRDKTNNVAVCPAKTQISLGILSV